MRWCTTKVLKVVVCARTHILLSLETLTPSHLICGRRLGNLPDVNAELDPYGDCVENLSTEILSRRMKYMMFLLTHFWRRFTTEYLNELREHYKANSRTGTVEIAVGDVVVVKKTKICHVVVGR